ncbi:hypothetical protein [Bosea sp. (in: a-proteobacteria)]|uniref:hypothetical protein n=1 Tax=Bosea sp. (in: a-proteobacteria) TaxID=1871050 RepID=UPI002735EE99|nr:hypothetical protein [Bosea sp. (in: a-proteobacteria)]MDP3411016.1 hypothetical protein [Bosea sp. (in: a-proteobacteria)]
MTEVRRQEVDWQKAATVVMARGDFEAGLRAYAMQDRLELVSGTEAAQERTIAAWRELRQAHGDDVLIVARRNDDAADLNRKARKMLKQKGRLEPDAIALPSIDRADKAVSLALAIGDRLRFGETLPQHGIRNGNRATVRAIALTESETRRVTLDLDDGRRLDLNWRELARQPRYGRKRSRPRIVHSYAGTAHSVQGRSAAASVVHIARETDAREIYVSLSRHRHDTRIIVERDRLDALCRQRQADTRMPASDAAVQERLFITRLNGEIADKDTCLGCPMGPLRQPWPEEPHAGKRLSRLPALAWRRSSPAFGWRRPGAAHSITPGVVVRRQPTVLHIPDVRRLKFAPGRHES